jgi:hypothetical protein
MAIFTVSIMKRPVTSETPIWSNVYHLDGGTLETVHAFAVESILAAEIIFHSSAVQFTEVRTSDLIPGTDVFIAEPVDDEGEYSVSGDLLPIFLAGRVDLVRGLGRSLRKFYHACLGEADQAAGLWNSSWTSTANDELVRLIENAGLDGLRFVSKFGGSVVQAPRVQARVTQHQFKRKWARRTLSS